MELGHFGKPPGAFPTLWSSRHCGAHWAHRAGASYYITMQRLRVTCLSWRCLRTHHSHRTKMVIHRFVSWRCLRSLLLLWADMVIPVFVSGMQRMLGCDTFATCHAQTKGAGISSSMCCGPHVWEADYLVYAWGSIWSHIHGGMSLAWNEHGQCHWGA